MLLILMLYIQASFWYVLTDLPGMSFLTLYYKSLCILRRHRKSLKINSLKVCNQKTMKTYIYSLFKIILNFCIFFFIHILWKIVLSFNVFEGVSCLTLKFDRLGQKKSQSFLCIVNTNLKQNSCKSSNWQIFTTNHRIQFNLMLS